MNEKTYSQKIARVFEIVDYILLVPAILGVLLATLIFSGATLIVYGVFISGVLLLIGYRRHSRGNLSPENMTALWMGTAIYNFILLLPCLFLASKMIQQGVSADTGFYFLFIFAVVAGYLAAIISALKAYQFEKRRKFL